MRLIDADALMEELIDELGDSEVLYSIPPDYIDDAPTIDAVKVVRCKDCEEYISLSEGDYFCGRVGSYFGNTKPDDFCSRGVRKMNAEVEG